MNDGAYTIKKIRKGLTRRMLREASERRIRMTSPAAPSEVDKYLEELRTQRWGPRQLTKAPRRKQP